MDGSSPHRGLVGRAGAGRLPCSPGGREGPFSGVVAHSVWSCAARQLQAALPSELPRARYCVTPEDVLARPDQGAALLASPVKGSTFLRGDYWEGGGGRFWVGFFVVVLQSVGWALPPCSPVPTLFPVLCCTRCSAGPRGSRRSGWGPIPEASGGTECPLAGRSEPTCVSPGIPGDLRSWWPARAGSQPLLIRACGGDGQGVSGQGVSVRREHIKGGLPWAHARSVREQVHSSLSPWLRCPTCPLQTPASSVHLRIGDARSLFPSPTLRWTQ